MKFSDKEIIQAIRDGKDEKVISSLYNSLLPGIVKYICANKGTSEDAFDLFQDALLIFVKMVITGKFNSDVYKIHPYIFTIAKNLWTNKVIRKGLGLKWEKTKIEEENEELIVGSLISEERKKILDAVFNSLGQKCIEILSLFYYQGLSMKDIAAQLNMASADVAKLKAHRCRKELAEKIKSNSYILEQLKNG